MTSLQVRTRTAGLARTFLVELVPSDPDLRALITRHRLFAKEIAVFEGVVPLLREYLKKRSEVVGKKVEVPFMVPNFVYGDVDEETGAGVIVFEVKKIYKLHRSKRS